MKGWNKIDLHQHTLNEVTYDGKSYKSSYSHKDFEELLKLEGVKLKAVTNHNTLHLSDHIKHALICNKNNINYLPGVEIDYKFNGKDVHAITILNPQNDVIPFSNILNEIISSKQGNKFLDREEFANLHQNIEYIFIPHVMKTKGIYPSSNKPPIDGAEDWVMSMIQNGIFVPVIFENTQDYFKYSIYAKIAKYFEGDCYQYPACYVGSDYKFDNDVERKRKAVACVKYYINAEPTYRGLEIAVRNHKTRLAHENDLIQRKKYITGALIKKNKNFSECGPINFSPYLNVIVGGSGTGKTLLLNEIYRQFTSDDLSATKSKRSGKKAYFSKTGNMDIVDLKIVPNDISQFKVLEIPNIYTEIMKYVNDTEKLSEIFGISNKTYISSIVDEYSAKCNLFEEYLAEQSESKKKGEDSLKNIISCIDFMNLNKNEKSLFELKIKSMKELKSTHIQKMIDSNKELLSKKEEIIKYFERLGTALDSEYDEKINELIDIYVFLLEKLMIRNQKLSNDKNEFLFIEKIENIINLAIRDTNKKLGQKEQAYKDREEALLNNTTVLLENIKKCLKSEVNINRLDLKYPYDSLKKIIEEKNSNGLARFTLSFTKDDISQIDILSENSILIDSNKKITKFKTIDKQKIDFNDSDSVKQFIINLSKIDLQIKNVLIKDVPLKLELQSDGLWKDATLINQGTIAKISMTYYFQDLIKNEQPDIIFIDQPENDVDKEFLTTTLATFLLKQKMTTQIFITSHDPILTVNADANMIIQADVDQNNKIHYVSYPMEYSKSDFEGTNRVANILDGGKYNVEKRYQIYGGILRYGN